MPTFDGMWVRSNGRKSNNFLRQLSLAVDDLLRITKLIWFSVRDRLYSTFLTLLVAYPMVGMARALTMIRQSDIADAGDCRSDSALIRVHVRIGISSRRPAQSVSDAA
ncbi:hypothetical protein [Brucella sp. JSBI001]|uniref:hypothetical protein n=1 Tax=Brucella sp. JSBI001 TaxID=2886044 RepID=UPI002231B166|nr:hypothetical protein [Brucella sp. JSBI001]UZD68243.1 hypothetical protein LJ361_13845 [Brucella sp. JSBI001]